MPRSDQYTSKGLGPKERLVAVLEMRIALLLRMDGIMKKYLIIFWVVALILTLSAAAKPESFVTGGFKVSFNLNTTQDYTTQVAQPIMSETFGGIKSTFYHIYINSTYNIAEVGVQDFKGTQMLLDQESLKTAIESQLSSHSPSGSCGKVLIIERTIDGKPGVLGTVTCLIDGISQEMFMAGYAYDNSTFVKLGAAYPWNNGTSNLVKTIHIEKLNR